MNAPRLFHLSIVLLLAFADRSWSATYTIVVKGPDGEFIEDAQFDVRTKTQFPVLKVATFNRDTKTYSLEIDEPKLDAAQKVPVELTVSAPGRVRAVFSYLLGKHEQKIGILLPRSGGTATVFPGGTDCGDAAAIRKQRSRVHGDCQPAVAATPPVSQVEESNSRSKDESSRRAN